LKATPKRPDQFWKTSTKCKVVAQLSSPRLQHQKAYFEERATAAADGANCSRIISSALSSLPPSLPPFLPASLPPSLPPPLPQERSLTSHLRCLTRLGHNSSNASFVPDGRWAPVTPGGGAPQRVSVGKGKPRDGTGTSREDGRPGVPHLRSVWQGATAAVNLLALQLSNCVTAPGAVHPTQRK
jgi:hypothetical protein